MDLSTTIASTVTVSRPEMSQRTAKAHDEPTGFGAVLEILVTYDGDQDRSEEQRRRDAEILALCVGMSTLECQGDGTGTGADKDRQSGYESHGIDVSCLSCEDAALDSRQGNAGKNSNISISMDNIVRDSGAGGSADDGRPPSDRAMTAIMEELVRRLQGVISARKPDASLTVSLDELGEVKLHVRFAGRNMSVRAEVANQRAAALLTSATPELRDRLAATGWRLSRLELCFAGNSTAWSSVPGKKRDSDGQRPLGPAVVAHDGALDVLA